MVNPTMVLVTSEEIDSSEITQLVGELGGGFRVRDFVMEWLLKRGRARLWISPEPGAASLFEEETLARVTSLLGSKPTASFVLEMSRGAPTILEGAEKLALQFACAFARRWRAVLCDTEFNGELESPRVYSAAELSEMESRGGRFSSAAWRAVDQTFHGVA